MKQPTRRLGLLLRRRIRSVAHSVARALPRPVALSDRVVGESGLAAKRVVVFARLPNPSVDYYLRARLSAPGMPPAEIHDIRNADVTALDPDGAFVIICRYATRHVLKWVDRHSRRLAGVGYFTDDDIGAVVTGSEAKIGYRLFLYQRALAPLRRLNRHIDVVWTATPALAEALGNDRIRVLSPAPPASIWRKAADGIEAIADGNRPSKDVRIVYHATGIHLREHVFLAPIVAEVLRRRPSVRFEVTADNRAREYWADLPRVSVVAPSSWDEYLDRTSRERADIALVPLLASRANRVRAGTKRIDVARLGAAGVFSRSDAYGEHDGLGEIILENQPETWVATILRLVDDAELRRSVAFATRIKVEEMGRQAENGISEILAPIASEPRLFSLAFDEGTDSDEELSRGRGLVLAASL